MTGAVNKPIRSPAYPSLSLKDAVDAVRKIESQYRSSAIDRELAAKLVGYRGLSGPANKALAALSSYGLLERAGKGEARVTERARAILHAGSEAERKASLLTAAADPPLFRDIRERFSGIAVPPEDGVVTYLNRQGFNPTAIKPAARAFLQTMSYLEELGATESHGAQSQDEPESPMPDGEEAVTYGGAKVGDLVQWDSQGSLQFPKPLRVRFISEDGEWVAVEGSEKGIPMSEVIVEKASTEPQRQPPPTFPFAKTKDVEIEEGYEQWFRAKVGTGKQIMISYRGEGEIGSREIQKLIDILTAQKAALEE